MILQATGGQVLVWLMRLDRPSERDSEWLLFGPTDPAVVEGVEAAPTTPAAPCASAPSTGRR